MKEGEARKLQLRWREADSQADQEQQLFLTALCHTERAQRNFT